MKALVLSSFVMLCFITPNRALEQQGETKPYISRPRYTGKVGKRSHIALLRNDERNEASENLADKILSDYINKPMSYSKYITRPRYSGAGKRNLYGTGFRLLFEKRSKAQGAKDVLKDNTMNEEVSEFGKGRSIPRAITKEVLSKRVIDAGESPRKGKKIFISRSRYTGRRDHGMSVDADSYTLSNEEGIGKAPEESDVVVKEAMVSSLVPSDQLRKGSMPYRMRHRYFGGKRKKEHNLERRLDTDDDEKGEELTLSNVRSIWYGEDSMGKKRRNDYKSKNIMKDSRSNDMSDGDELNDHEWLELRHRNLNKRE